MGQARLVHGNPTMNMRCNGAALAALGLIAAGVGGPADAATYVVGPTASGCTHATPQAAVDAAQANPGSDTIRLTRAGTWSAQQLVIDTAQEIDLLGGFATCTSTAADATPTTLSGAGGNPRPVLTIRGNGVVRLRNLVIREGDPAGTDSGGGIHFVGGGILDVADTAIVDNRAYNGGGLYARGTTTAAEVVLGRNVTVQGNIARNDGGGVLADSLEFSLTGPGSSLLLNEALGQGGGGYGGGILVLSGQFDAFAYLYSGGIGGIGAVFGNRAVYGGGIALYGARESGRDANLQAFSVDPARAMLVHQNIASAQGGAIYLNSDADTTASDASASAELYFTDVVGNQAPDGAAVFVDPERGGGFTTAARGSVYFNVLPFTAPVAHSACPQTRECGAIRDNTASGPDGAVIKGLGNSDVTVRRIVIAGNVGDRLVEVRGNESGDVGGIGAGAGTFVAYNSLIVDNTVGTLIEQPENSDADTTFTLHHVTITDNAIAGPHVIRARDSLNLLASIVWQPGKPTLAGPAPGLDVLHVISNDITHMPPGGGIIRAPRFIDPANGNYRLRAGAWGVDSALFDTSAFFYPMQRETLDGGAHTVDLPGVGSDGQNRFADMGAYERPTVAPLVLNADFDTGLNLWDEVGLDTTWSSTQNASGPPGSGSMRIDLNPGSTQCITLPAAGTYRLNGWGRVSPATLGQNRAVLRWQLRFDGGSLGCREGTVTGSGVHELATNLTWTRPQQSTEIVVPAGEFRRGSTSITIQPDAIGSGGDRSSAWFDGITLESGTDGLFGDGFE